jgi:hypothetical protein
MYSGQPGLGKKDNRSIWNKRYMYTGLSDRKSSLARLSGIKTVRHKQGTNLKSFIRLAGIPKQKTNNTTEKTGQLVWDRKIGKAKFTQKYLASKCNT